METSPSNGPPLELMHLAAAGNTVVGDKYGLFLFFKCSFVSLVRSGARGEGGGIGEAGEGESRSNTSVG